MVLSKYFHISFQSSSHRSYMTGSSISRAVFGFTLRSPCIQLFLERLSENMCTRQSRKVIWDTINKLFLLFLTLYCKCRTYFCCFPLALANRRPWPLLPFFQISLKNIELKTTHNIFRDCRVLFF